MSDIQQSKPEAANPIAEAWDLCQQTMLARGLDFEAVLTVWKAWTEKERQKLAAPGARDDFDELCQVGCVPQVLVLILALMRFSPELNEFCELAFGDPEEYEKTWKSLEKASASFKEVFATLLALEDEDMRMQFTKIGHIPPSRFLSEIRFYAGILKFFEEIRALSQLNSLPELAKFLLVGYVERATGTWCDRNISGLIGDILGPIDHNEVAQRQWRYRNYQRLHENYQRLIEMLYVLSLEVTRRA